MMGGVNPAISIAEADPAKRLAMDNLSADFDQGLNDSIEDRYDDNFSDDRSQKKKKKKRVKMMCFSCNRPEHHSLKAKKRWLFSFVLGMTFGLSFFIGPFTCVCCGNSRLMCRNWLNLRYWFRKGKTSRAASSKR